MPGVPGIGVKTAAELINEYGDLETLLARAGEIKQPKRRERLIEFAMQARLSLDLVTLKQDVPVVVPVEQLGVRDAEPTALLGFLREMEFGTLTKRIAEGLGADAPPPVERSAGSTVSHAGGPATVTDSPAKPGAKRGAAPSGATPQAAVALATGVVKAKIDRSEYETVTKLPQLGGMDRRSQRRRPLRLRYGDNQPRSDAGRVRRLLDGRRAGPGLLRAARASRGQRRVRLRRGRHRAGADRARRWKRSSRCSKIRPS